MIRRCTNPDDAAWKHYGGRGIKVCERWMTFGNFLEDMGEPPENLTLDRTDNDGNYEIGNIQYATNLMNCSHTSRTTVAAEFHAFRIAHPEIRRR